MREAKRLLQTGSAAQLRVAYILLDNAAEVIMYRSIYPELIHNNLYANLLKQWEEILKVSDSPEAMAHYEEVKALAIPEKKLNKIENDFSEKANFLLGKAKITSDIATSLKELHRYRNEMYHRDHVRYDVLKAVTALYFDVVCALVERYDETTQHPYVIGPPISFGGSATSERFKPPASVLAEELQSGLEWDWPEMARDLKKNLQLRLGKSVAIVGLLSLSLDVDEETIVKLALTYREHPTSGPEELKKTHRALRDAGSQPVGSASRATGSPRGPCCVF